MRPALFIDGVPDREPGWTEHKNQFRVSCLALWLELSPQQETALGLNHVPGVSVWSLHVLLVVMWVCSDFVPPSKPGVFKLFSYTGPPG